MAEMIDLTGKTCLVTGGAGMIGSHIVDLLINEHKCKVKVVDDLKVTTHPTQKKPVWVPDEVEFIKGDAADRKLMEGALQGVQVVFHQCAMGFEQALPSANENCFRNATMSTCVLFDVIRDLKLPVEKVVTASSMAVYGEASYKRSDGTLFTPDGYRSKERLDEGKYEVVDEKGEEVKAFAIPETRALLPPHPYHLAKMCQEKITIAAGQMHNISTTALRYTIVHGPRQSVHNPYTGVISIFCTRVMNGKPPIIFEDGKQTRDFMYAEDIARANVFVAQHPDTNGQVYNVASGRGGDTMLEMASYVCDLLKGDKDIKPACNSEYRMVDTRHILLDASKLMALGWKPRYTLQSGLAKHTEWAKEVAKTEGVVEDRFEKAYAVMVASGLITPTKRQKLT
jgi:dTDP-L-rhamnose 4-epimerase